MYNNLIISFIGTSFGASSPHNSMAQLVNFLEWQNAIYSLDIDAKKVLNYGCWCNLYNGPVVGRGEPVDELDA